MVRRDLTRPCGFGSFYKAAQHRATESTDATKRNAPDSSSPIGQISNTDVQNVRSALLTWSAPRGPRPRSGAYSRWVTSECEAETEYTVVLRAPSAARFLPEEGLEIMLNVPALGLEGLRLRAFTRWVNEGGNEIPRELVVEVRGRSGSLNEAISKFAAVTRPIATVVGFAANVLVGPVEVHLAYDSTPWHEERAFLETFLPDERGAVMAGRVVRRDLLHAVATAFVSFEASSERVGRALRQYEMALRYWFVGGEWLALSHLWMAVEALTERGHQTRDLTVGYR